MSHDAPFVARSVQENRLEQQQYFPLDLYSATSVFSLPVTIEQVTAFNPRERGQPSRVMSDGSEYYGDILLDVPHGIGIMLFKSSSSLYGNGARYGGAWKNGQSHGEGVLVTDDFIYQGGWVDGEMHGQGQIIYSRKVTNIVLRGISLISPFDVTNMPLEYKGEFHCKKHRHGYGVMRYMNGDVYSGEWASNFRHGQGRYVTSEGEVYEGEWKQGERHGYGKTTYENGGEFKGAMLRDKRHGEGVMIFPNGDEYYGAFENDKIKGYGTMRYKNGDVYEGLWKDGLRNGQGKYTLRKQGATVEGCFVNGLIQGKGTVKHPGVSTFVGEFDRGERQYGTLFWHFFTEEKACYQGGWLGEAMHDQGLLWYRNGDFFFGHFVKNKRHGPGNIRYADGSEYSGYFANDLREGKGILQRSNGSIQAGVWHNDVFLDGYDGEWDGVTFKGIGRLLYHKPPSAVFSDAFAEQGKNASVSSENNASGGNTTSTHGTTKNQRPVMDHVGLFLNGMRHGAGILRLAGHVIMGNWVEDMLSCKDGVWEFPSGDLYVGGFHNGLRDGPDGRMWLADGSCFIGNWQMDMPVGNGLFYATDHNDPIYAPEESTLNAATLSGDAKNYDSEKGKSLFGVMNYFMGFFRSKAVQKKDTRRVIGFNEHFLLQGEWKAAHISYAIYKSLIQHSGVGDGSVAMTHAFLEPNTDTISAGAVFCKPPALIPVGVQERHGVVFFKSGVCLRTEWLYNYSRLMLPHRADAPFYSKIYGEHQDNGNSGADSGADELSKSCTFCKKPFTFFRKESVCSLCERSSCSSCLHPIEVRGCPKIEALVRLRMAHVVDGGSVTNSGSNSGDTVSVGDNAMLPQRMPACVDCARSTLLDMEFNTIWIPWRCSAFAKENQREAGNTQPGMVGAFTKKVGSKDREETLSVESFFLNSTTTTTTRTTNVKNNNNDNNDNMRIVYEGYTSNCIPHVYGSLWFGKHGYYIGSFDKGRRSGRGLQMFANGEKYVGQFLDDTWHGVGIYCTNGGSVYEGLWKHGKLETLSYHGEVDDQYRRHGRGQSYDADGVCYNGEWMQGQKHGTGIFKNQCGEVYSGEFKFGCIEGEGRLLHDSSVFYGTFCDGKKNGKGIEYFGNYAFDGEWQNDLLTGHVKIYDSVDETVYETTYFNGNERDDCFAPPVMVDDFHSSECVKCRAAFTLFLRRHHCRLCGNVFCDGCTQRRASMPLHFKVIGQKRVCDCCYNRIEQRRMLGIKRYKNGEVYAGYWTRGRWVSRGLLCRADGSAVVMDSAGRPLLGGGTSPPPAGAAGEGELPPDAAPSAEELRALPGSPDAEVDAFTLWWGMLLDTAELSTPLELTPCTTFKLPETPKMKPLRLFSENNGDSSCGNGGAAAMRATRYTPSVLPPPPTLPTHAAESSFWSVPKRQVITDAHIMRLIRDGRMELFPAPGVSGNQHKALLPPTPLPPPANTDERVRWGDWQTRPVPQYNCSAVSNTQKATVEWKHVLFACPFLRPAIADVDRAVRGNAARWQPNSFAGPQLFTLIETQNGVVVKQREADMSLTLNE